MAAILHNRKFLSLVLAALLVTGLISGSGARPAAAQMNMPSGAPDGLVCTSMAGSQPTFTLTAQTGYIGTPDGNVVFMWGLSEGANPFQHPGPILCVNQNDTVTIIVHNTLNQDISLIFPGQENVLADGMPSQPQFDTLGGLTSLAPVAPANGGSMTYQFVATHPGTFLYESGTNPGFQVPLGLFGAIVVRPTAGDHYVYNDSGAGSATSQFNPAPGSEVLVLQSEIDPYLNQAVERGEPFDLNNYHPRYWLINGRGFPDTLAPNFASWLPSQPYGALAHIQPNDPTTNPLPYLERFLNVTSQVLPFHPHGKNARVIGQDGQPARNDLGQDMSYERFSLTAAPGETFDALFHWEDREKYDPATNPPPVTDPGWQNLAYGMYYSGSPYLGQTGAFPPGMSSMSQCGEYYIIAHNHALYQVTSWGVVMTGPATFLRIDPPGGCPPMP